LRSGSGIDQTGLKPGDKPVGPFARAHHRADRSDHVENAGDASLVEGMYAEPVPNEFGGDVCLEIGEAQDEIRAQRQDLVGIS
jgi:hypothetical protein